MDNRHNSAVDFGILWADICSILSTGRTSSDMDFPPKKEERKVQHLIFFLEVWMESTYLTHTLRKNACFFFYTDESSPSQI